MFVTLRGEPYVLWRAVDQHGIELDILLQKRRDKAAAKRFFKRVLAAGLETPKKIVTDEREARLRQGDGPRQQPGREQSSAYA